MEPTSTSAANSHFEHSGQSYKSLLLLQDDRCESSGLALDKQNASVVDSERYGLCCGNQVCTIIYADCCSGCRSELVTHFPDSRNWSVLATTKTSSTSVVGEKTLNTTGLSAMPRNHLLRSNSLKSNCYADFHLPESVCSASSSDNSLSTQCSDEPSGSNSVSSLIGDAAQTVYDHDMLSFDYHQTLYGVQVTSSAVSFQFVCNFLYKKQFKRNLG
jgi:hypothetical protein